MECSDVECRCRGWREREGVEVCGGVSGSAQRHGEWSRVCQGAVPAEGAVGCLAEGERVDELPAAGRGAGKEGRARWGRGWEGLLCAAEHCRGVSVVLMPLLSNSDELEKKKKQKPYDNNKTASESPVLRRGVRGGKPCGQWQCLRRGTLQPRCCTPAARGLCTRRRTRCATRTAAARRTARTYTQTRRRPSLQAAQSCCLHCCCCLGYPR